jgi:hypothetical protein
LQVGQNFEGIKFVQTIDLNFAEQNLLLRERAAKLIAKGKVAGKLQQETAAFCFNVSEETGL